MSSFYARDGAGDLLARYSFLEPLLDGKRVLEVGAARATEGGSALFLAERGAAAVLSIESAEDDLAAAREAGHHPFVQFRAMSPSDLRPGTFDLVLVADGAALAREPDRVAAFRRLLAPGGRLVTSLPAGGGGLPELAGEPAAADVPEYEAFVGALSDQFALVEVATQSAVVGWVLALAADGVEDPEVSMDGTLAGTAETGAYLAICGDEPCELVGLSLIALPVKPLLDAAAEARGAREESGEARRLLERAEASRQATLAQLSARAQELDEAFATRDDALRGREAARAERDAAISAREAAVAELADARAARASAEHDAADARGARAVAEAALERLRAETSDAAGKARELEALLEAEREAAFEARAALDRAQSADADRAREAQEARAAAVEAAARNEAELAERRAVAVEAEAALRAARSESQAAKSGIEAVLARAVAAEGRVAELEEALDAKAQEADGEIARLAAELGDVRDRAAALEAGAAGRDAVEAAEAVRDEARADAESARGELEALRAELAGIRRELEGVREERDAARRDAEEARARAAGAEASASELEPVRGELERLRGELERSEESAREAASVREALEAQAAELGARIEAEEERLRIAEARAAEARALLETAQEAQAAAGAPSDEVARLKGEVEEYARARAALDMEVTALRNTADAAEAQAAALEAELQAVRWEKDEIEQRLAGAQAAAGVGPPADAARLRDELAARVGDVARREKELAEKEAALEAMRAQPAAPDGHGAEALRALEDRLADALKRAEDAEAAAESAAQAARASPAPAEAPDAAGALVRATQEKDGLVAQVTERDAKIARLQREVADKTDRLGRLAKEMGELKAKGLGKIFR